MSDPAPEPSARTGHFVREVFETSRRLEFCTEKELVAQTGYDRSLWPAYAVHELFDNALDACEDKGILPEIRLRVDEGSLEVAATAPAFPRRWSNGCSISTTAYRAARSTSPPAGVPRATPSRPW
jgi:hypothetical protein